jgi:hypothetical protein
MMHKQKQESMMTHEQAKTFIQTIFKAWEAGEFEKASSIYSSTVKGSLDRTQTFGFEEIEHRMKYLATHHQQRQYQILDLVTSGNKIAVHLAYSAFDEKLQQKVDCALSGMYTLNEKNQVETIDIITSEAFNYRETL